MATEPTSSQSRLQDELRGLVRGDVRCDDLTLQLFSSDGSPYQERPLGVVWPRVEQDVSAVVQYASEKNLSVHLRGSGTSGSAAAIGSGIILDFSRYMRRAVELGDDFVRVQPGAIRERINGMIRTTKGRFFAPSSGHVPTGTIGGILAVDNIGPRWLRYGSPHESVLELKVASASGEIWTLRPFRARRGTLDRYFRRRFLNAALAEANAVAQAAGDPLPDPLFDSELTEAAYSPEASYYGLDFNDGYGARSFRSDFVREEFFKRAFDSDARTVRELVAKQPWVDALRAIREVEPFLDDEQKTAPLRCGYALRDVVRDGFDPTRFFVGSEGTLGAVVEAKLATFLRSSANCAVILLFDSIDKAIGAVPEVLTFHPTLCDLLDSRVVSLTRDWDERFEPLLLHAAQAALVIEFDSNSEKKLRACVDDFANAARDRMGAFASWKAFTREERVLFRDLLRHSSCARMRMAPNFQPFPFWDDARVPVEAEADFLRDVRNLFKREHIVYSIGGNVGVGQISIQPILPYSDEEERRAFALSDQYEELVLSYGGEIGVAKGNGRLRTAVLPKRYPHLFRAFVKVKDAFDAGGRFNPDCVVSPEMRALAKEDARPRRKRDDATVDFGDYLAPETDALLRESALHARSIVQRAPFDLEKFESAKNTDWASRPKRSQLECQIDWNPTPVYPATYQCVGCGHCRIRTSETRMCPAFRKFPDEYASPRAKANLLRGALDGDLELETITREDSMMIAQRCVRCHCCAYECPAQVDAPRLAFRLTSAYRAAVGLGLQELFAIRADFVLNVATLFATQIRKKLESPLFRWALERVLGLAQGRKLPVLENVPYLKRVSKERDNERWLSLDGLQDAEQNLVFDARTKDNSAMINAPSVRKSRGKVALFIDSFANYFDADLVDLTIEILERNGLDVVVPTRPKRSGAVAFALGDLDCAENLATRNASAFRELTRDGALILTLEPSAAVTIKREYPYFLNDDEKSVCANVTDVCSYLVKLLRNNEFDRDSLRPIDSDKKLVVGYHAPCRSLALAESSVYAPTRAQTLLELIPNLEVRRLENGCCGFSGFSGFTKRRFGESLRIGGRLLIATRDRELDLCSSECSFCNMQMAQVGAKSIAHALKLLAASYGLVSLESAVMKTIGVRSSKERR